MCEYPFWLCYLLATGACIVGMGIIGYLLFVFVRLFPDPNKSTLPDWRKKKERGRHQ